MSKKTFDKIDFTEKPLPKDEYENSIFIMCNFSNSDLSDIKFIDCEFIGCDLSMAKLENTALRDVKFKDSKMLGLQFDTCHEFGLSFSFENCLLNHSSFFKTKQNKIIFKDSQLQEVDFSECDLSGSLFDSCDLAGAVFKNTILEKADFRTSFNYSLDPEHNRIKKAKFSLSGAVGLLDKYNIIIE